jgi:hypothetical protein
LISLFNARYITIAAKKSAEPQPIDVSPNNPIESAPNTEKIRINGANHFRVDAVHTGLLVAKQDSPPRVKHRAMSAENPFERARRNIYAEANVLARNPKPR